MWFGPEERPLFGWLHRPASGLARGAVVLCPPVAVELSFSHYLFKVLARELQAAGFLVVRFDYDGTGQSAGEFNDPHRVSAWSESIRHAAALARSQGAEWVAGVGLRLGATVLGHAAADGCAFDAMVLWDPCASGRLFLREQVALQRSFHRPREDRPGTEIPGYRLAPETVAELRGLELPAEVGQLSPDVFALLDPTRVQNDRLPAGLFGPQVEREDYAEEMGVFDIGERQYRLPIGILSQVVRWLDGRCDRAPASLIPSAGEAGLMAVATGADGARVVEEPIVLGPSRLFGITCAREGQPTDGRPIVLFASMAAEPSIGPGRQWVTLSRQLAAAGVRAVRFDLSGIGESPARPGRGERHIYAPWALDDIREAAHAVSPEDPRRVVLVGVCSGAYSALAVAPHLRPMGVVAINPLLTTPAFAGWSPERTDEERDHDLPPQASGRPLLRRILARVMDGVRDRGRDASWRRGLADRLPPALWWVVFKLGLSRSPAYLIDPIRAMEIPTLLMCGRHEAELPLARTPRAFRRFAQSAGSRFEIVPDLDHSLRDADSRSEAGRAMRRFLTEVSGVALELPHGDAEEEDAVAAPTAAAA